MNELYELSGNIQRFLFRNEENGFCVGIIDISGQKDPTTITGYLPSVHAGEYVTLRGSWITHPKFGKQFEIQSYTKSLPTSKQGLKAYLSSGLIKGIGPVYAEKMVNHFGTDVLTIIDKAPDRLLEVSGIGKGRVEKIIIAWREQRDIADVMVFLQDKGISPTYAIKLYKKYGHTTVAIVQENPYRLAEEVWGIGFMMADAIARNLGISADSPKRIRAGILHCLSSVIKDGHLYCDLEELRTQIYELLSLDESIAKLLVKNALHELHEQQKIKVLSFEEKHYVTLSHYYQSEKGIASKIRSLQQYAQKYTFNLDRAYQLLRVARNEHDSMLTEQQQEGVMTCLQNKVTIITGGPGTGKTTLIKKLLQILDDHKMIYKLAAPTGRAAKRITESTGKHALTLHRLLEFDVASRSFKHNESNALQLSVLIIDEASMIDVFLGYSVIRALPLHAHLVLIGDIDQLPSVGPGNFLNDLIASNTIATVRLTTIFRQAQDSLIITNAHRINKGEFPKSNQEGSRNDYFFIEESDPLKLPDHLRSIFKNTLGRHHIARKDTIILTPMNRGGAGTHVLNQALQEILNPITGKEAIRYAHTVFTIGDPVMQIRNNYDKHVFNGDTGTIIMIDAPEKQLTVQFPDQQVIYEFAELDELVLAYAATIHKSQGSEYAAVIVPLFSQHFTLLRRNLIYTAITRAKKLCIFIGEYKALAMAINNTKDIQRVTFLRHFLTSDLACH